MCLPIGSYSFPHFLYILFADQPFCTCLSIYPFCFSHVCFCVICIRGCVCVMNMAWSIGRQALSIWPALRGLDFDDARQGEDQSLLDQAPRRQCRPQETYYPVPPRMLLPLVLADSIAHSYTKKKRVLTRIILRFIVVHVLLRCFGVAIELFRRMPATWVIVYRLPMSFTRSLAATSLCSPTAGKGSNLSYQQLHWRKMIAWYRHGE